MKYPMIEKLGLWHHPAKQIALVTGSVCEKTYDMVKASDLEDMLSKAQRVYGYIGDHGNSWSDSEPGTYIQEKLSHTALLIAVEPIVKGVRKSEIVRALRGEIFGCDKLADRIEKEGVIDD